MLDFSKLSSATLSLLMVLNTFGSIPLFLKVRSSGGRANPKKVVFFAALIFIVALFGMEYMLDIFQLDKEHLKMAGALILFAFGIELLFNRNLFNTVIPKSGDISLVPFTFPILTGPGTVSALVAWKADGGVIVSGKQQGHEVTYLLLAIFINLLIIYVVLTYLDQIAALIGPSGVIFAQRFVGLLLWAMAFSGLQRYVLFVANSMAATQ